MTKSSKNFKGGLILTDKSLTGFAPVLHMLLSGSARIQALTVDSLSGFMITLNVDPRDSTYRHFQTIRVPNITNFIIKIVVITEKKRPLPKFNGKNKSSETESSFLTEARLQQVVWIRNIIGGKPEFTPSVANFALFDDKQSSNLLKCLGAKGGPDTMDIIHYLSKFHSWKLGVLLMPMIDNSVTLYNYLHTHPDDNDQFIAYSNTIANIVKLFIIVHVIHWDLHSGNAMIVDNDTKKSFLIDFGRASNIKKPIDGNHIPDDYIDAEEKEDLYKLAQYLADEFLSIRKTKRNYTNYTNLQEQEIQKQKQKSEFMEDVCRRLGVYDRFINGERIQGDYKEEGLYQMNWIESIYKSPDKDKVFLSAYEKLESDYLTSSVKITIKTINSYIKSGIIFNLDRDASEYYYEFLEDVVKSLPELQNETSRESIVAAPPPVVQNAFNSSILLEQHATPRTQQESPDAFLGGKTKKRKTRKIRSKRTKK